jgi:DegV family protein with EDD domain
MKLTADNTAIVLDSTADYPEGPSTYPNWRIVPLYVRFGDESFRDYVDLGPAQFYERLASAAELPSTSQPSPGDFAAAYEQLAGYERILSLQLSSTLSGTFASATAAAVDFPAVRVVDTRTVAAAIAMLAFAV